MGVIAFLIILSLLVFVHELGHFFTARKFGIGVEEFGFGLPPRAWGIKRGETIYSLNWIPLGGFVRIKGEEGENAGDPDSFVGRPVWQKAIVISAGVIMNVIFAAFLLSIGYMVGTPQIIDGNELANATIRDEQLIVERVVEDFPAVEAGIESGDVLLTIEDEALTTVASLQTFVKDKSGEELTLAFERAGEIITTTIIPTSHEDEDGIRGVIGVEPITTGVVSYSFFYAIYEGTITAGILLKDIVFAFGQIIHDFFVGEKVSVDLSGPVGIAIITTEIAKLGFIYLIQLSALLSLNLAVINFIPFPALDGGRFWFLMLEKIRGKALNAKTETVIHNTGFALLMFLILLVTIRDFSKFSLWDKVITLF